MKLRRTVYYLKHIKNKLYFKSRWCKGEFHYVLDINEAKALSKKDANRLLNELNHPENYEIIKRNINEGKNKNEK